MTSTEPYGTSTVRARATRNEMIERRKAFAEIIRTEGPLSVRHVYYSAITRHLIEKDSNRSRKNYSKVQRAALDLRRSGEIPYSLIVDNTRLMRKPTTWDSLDSMLADAARYLPARPVDGEWLAARGLVRVRFDLGNGCGYH